MGMFDYLKCEFKLPKGNENIQNEEFQTKDFECMLDLYTITKDKKLKCKSKGKIKTLPYHGDIRFYTSTGNHMDKTHKWYEFNARFSYGRLDYIKKAKNKKIKSYFGALKGIGSFIREEDRAIGQLD
ncbi:MAG: hypothetical protein AABX95_00325 [Nanoarchaeota archaeon]